MDIPITLRQQIIEFLTALPNIHDNNNRQALIYSAGLNSELHGQINFAGASKTFFQILVETLLNYGTLQDGRHALEAILEAAKQNIGIDRQALCDQLLQNFRTLPSQGGISDLLKTSNLTELREQCPPLDTYLTAMQKRYGMIRVFGMPKPISLENIYIYVNILDTPSTFQRAFKEQLEISFQKNRSFGRPIGEQKDGLEMVREHNYLFILGKPGSGKTTFLKYITLQTIQGRFPRIPIFISLNRFANSGKTLQEFIREQFELCGFSNTQIFVEHLLQSGRTLLLCDGLDEITQKDGTRSHILQELTGFIEKYEYAGNQYVITCRIAATEYFFEPFTYVEIADFNNRQVQQFVKHWFENTGDQKEFLQELSTHRYLKEFTQIPLLLGFLCLVFKDLHSFPSKRSQLYQETLDILLKRWDSSRGIVRDEVYKELSFKGKQQMFAQIAIERFEKGEYIFEQKVIEKIIVTYLNYDIDEEVILKAIEAQHGILVERAKGLYSFLHLTFQEYFTARYIVENSYQGTLQGLIQNHCTDKNWHEVFLLTTEMLNNVDVFFEIFLSALDTMVQKEKRLQELLIKVEQEVTTLQSYATLFEKRGAIINLILETAKSSAYGDSDNNPLDALRSAHDRSSKFAYYRSSEIAHDRAIVIARDIAVAIEHAIHEAWEISIDKETEGKAYARAKAGEKASLLVSDRAIVVVNSVINRSKQLGLIDLSNGLSVLSFPSNYYNELDWYEFGETLWAIFCTHFPVEDYTFTKEQTENIADYLAATELFIQCLQNAYVSDRDAIMERLLRTPQKK